MRRQLQLQEQVQLTAHQKKLVLENFHYTIEALEEYIEKAGYYPDFKNKKQLFKESINDASRTPAELADDFLTQLLCFKAIVDNKPEFFKEEIKEEFYKWINATGINVNNCPQELKHYLFEMNEILEGRGEKIVEQTRDLIAGVEIDPRDLVKVVGVLQKPLNDNREQGEILKGKTYRDVEIESRFNGNAKQGDIAFNRMAWDFNHNHFDFFPEVAKKKRQRAADDYWKWEQEEEERYAREQLKKKKKTEEVREIEQQVKEQTEVEIARKKLAQEQAEQAEEEKRRMERVNKEQLIKEKQEWETRKELEKEELASDRAKAFSQIHGYWSKRQDEQKQINGRSIQQVLGDSWQSIVLTAEDKRQAEVQQQFFIAKIKEAELAGEAKKQQDKERRENEEWERNASILAYHAYNNLLARINTEVDPNAEYTGRINGLDWGRLHGKQTKENLEEAWLLRRTELFTKNKSEKKEKGYIHSASVNNLNEETKSNFRGISKQVQNGTKGDKVGKNNKNVGEMRTQKRVKKLKEKVKKAANVSKEKVKKWKAELRKIIHSQNKYDQAYQDQARQLLKQLENYEQQQLNSASKFPTGWGVGSGIAVVIGLIGLFYRRWKR